MANQNPVWFNDKQKKHYDDLVRKGLVSRSFSEFVRDSYFNAVVEKIIQEKIQAITKAAP